MDKTTNSRTYKKIGSFNLSQPKMYVSDPGYDKGTRCTHTVEDCLTGKWIAAVNENNYPWEHDGKKGDDYRIASIFIRHESLPASYAVFNRIRWIDDNISYGEGWELLSDNIGVDSGQAGFFDFEKFGDNDLFEKAGKCGFGDKWYSNCCDTTLSPKAVGIIANMGINASSGFGDGCYTVWGRRCKDGKIDAMALFFLPDVETETEDEND